jgi:DNA-binding FadR family transcriptional regulator
VVQKLARGSDLTHAIQRQIRDHIIENGLHPGDLLPPEGQLASDLGVSRGSVREAVKALESLGILDVRHGTGVIVREFNFDSVFDLLTHGLVFDPARIGEILQIRKWLEAMAVDEVVAHITDEQIDAIEVVLKEWEHLANTGEPTSPSDRSFHQMLYEVVGNRSLIALIDVFWGAFHAVPVRSVYTDMRPSTTVQDHWRILRAVRRRDAAAARTCVLDHFRSIEQRLAEAKGL